ncbi:hypothetical protein QL285_086285 [Trifolium repens]|jgi:hypothetical protein|nr:hypothetical protein QL285_086285 [Trifolium repens]
MSKYQQYNSPSTYQSFGFPPPQQQLQHFGLPPSQVQLGNYVHNYFLQQLVNDAENNPSLMNSMNELLSSPFPAQSSGQNARFDLNTPEEEEEEEEEVLQLQT